MKPAEATFNSMRGTLAIGFFTMIGPDSHDASGARRPPQNTAIYIYAYVYGMPLDSGAANG